MISISDAGRQRLENYRGDWLITMTFTLLGGGDDLVVNRDRVWGGSLVLEDAVSNSGQFEIGSTHINQMTVTLLNTDGAYDAVNFLDATVKVDVGWHSGALITKGYYTIVDAQVSNGMIALKGYDYMDRFSRPYKLSTRTYPCTLKQIVAEACTFCNVTDGTGNFDHYSQRIAKKPDDDTLTFREVIGYVAQICGYNARVARNGRLQFVRYNLSGFNGEDTFNTITEVYSDRIDQDQIVITGIHVDEENTVVTTDSDGIKTTSLVTTGYDAGTDGYVISIAGNPLIKDGLGQNVASWLYTAFGGVPFRIGSVTHASDPCIEASDIMKVTDKYGTYNMLVSETRFCTGSAQTTASNAVSPRSNEAVQFTDIDKIKTVASEAHIVALAAQGYANDAQRAANEAQSSADSAAQAAQTAWNHADDAGEAAQTAWNRAGDALTAANNAQTSANNAATAASNAQTSANNAQTSANNAQTQAELATGYAGNALIQLSEVEQVANILNWIAEHGTYTKTADATIVKDKNYYVKSGNVYTLVTDPKQSDINNYYELHIDEALTNYVSTHLALTNDGLYVIKDANGYRLKIDESSVQVIDGSGTTVATYGSDITYDPYREHTIGNSSNYLKFFDSDGDGIADSIAIIANQILLGNKDVGDAIDSLENMEIGGRNLIHNTNTPDLTNSQTRPNINGHWEGFGYMVSPTTSQALTVTAEHGLKTTAIIQYAPWFYFGYSGTNQQYIQEASGCFGLKPGKTYTWSADIKCKMLSAQTATATRSLGMYFYYRTADNTTLILETYKYVIDYPVAEHGTEKSVHGVLTFTVPDDADGIRLICRCDQQTSSWFAVGDYLEMANIKLEEGNKATAWTPAPEDIDSDINGINVYLETLQDQVDGKAETFYQADDPSTNWTAAEKETHEGDLWYRTGDGVTLRYSGSTWQEQDIPRAVFDEIDGKAQIFVAQPTPPYAIGDLWVQGETGDILRCQQAKAEGQSYSADDWVKASKYTDDTMANQAIDVVNALEIGGRNLIRNTNVIDLSSNAKRPNINGDNTTNGCLTGVNTGTLTATEHGARHTVTDALRPGIVFGANNVNIGLHGLATGKTYTWSFDYTVKTFSGSPPTTSNYYLRATLGYVPEGESAFNTSTYANIHQYATTDLSDRGSEISGHGEFTFELPEGATAMRFYITTNSANTSYYLTGDYIELRNIKLEEGNVATAWTPAPEDIDSAIGGVSTEFTSFVDGTYANFVTNTTNALNGKVTTFYQTSQPTAVSTGDLWIDTDDKNKLYRWSGSAWTLVRDTDIQTALTAAGTAQATADSKIITFAQASQPTATDTGDLWIDTDANNKMYRWSGSSWVAVTDNSALKAFQDGTYATFVNSTNTALGNKITTFYQASQPTATVTGDLWIDTDDANKLYRWNGSAWTLVRDTGIQTALTNAATAQATADGKIMTYASASEPTGDLDTGDLWIDTDDNNKMYRWDGTQWADIQDVGIASAQSTAENALAQGLVLRVNSSTFTNTNKGECYYHGYNRWNVAADVDGWVMWNGAKVTIPKGCSINPNSTMPFDKTIYSVYRTSDTAFHDVCLIGDTWYGTKYTGNSPSARSAWTWDVATDIVLASYRIPAAEGAIYGARLFSPPKTYNDIVDVALKEAEDAKKVAINYMSQDSTGVMVADMRDGVQTPSTATGRNVLITNEDVQVRDGQASIASFGEGTRVGKKDEVHMEVESDRMVGVGELGETFFEIDANGAEREGEPLIYGLSPWNQYATYGSPQTWHFALGILGLTVGKSFKVSWGAGKAYVQYGEIQFTYGTSSTKNATANGVSVSVAYTYNATTGNSLELTITSSSSRQFRLGRIEITADYKTPTFRFGTSDGDRGAYSSSFGEGITNIDEDAMVVGRYNDPDIERDPGDGSYFRLFGNPLFVVGNGSDENNRSNAFRVHEKASVVEGDLIVTGSINNGRVITSIQIVSANVSSIAMGASATVTIDISDYDYPSPPELVIPYSTGWLTTVAPSSVSSTSITGVVWNFSNGSHSGTCQYLLIELSEVEE